MDDLYVECLVAKKARPTDALIKGAVIGLTALCAAAGLLMYPIFLVGALAGGLAIWLLLPNLSVEYEYLYISRSLQIDKILSKEKRKKIVEYDLEQMDIFAEEGAWQLDDHKNVQCTEKDYTSGDKEAPRWVMIVHNGTAIDRVCLEPSEALISAIKSQFPRKTFKKQ